VSARLDNGKPEVKLIEKRTNAMGGKRVECEHMFSRSQRKSARWLAAGGTDK